MGIKEQPFWTLSPTTTLQQSRTCCMGNSLHALSEPNTLSERIKTMADTNNTQQEQKLLVIAYEGETRANEVLRALQQMEKAHLVRLRNAAVVSRNAQGKIALHETHDFDAKEGALAGALAGGLLGLIRGEIVEDALLGAGAGFLASKVMDLGFKDDYLKEIGEHLTPNSSAIVAVVHFEQVDPAVQELRQFGGHLLQQTLPADVAQKLVAVA